MILHQDMLCNHRVCILLKFIKNVNSRKQVLFLLLAHIVTKPIDDVCPFARMLESYSNPALFVIPKRIVQVVDCVETYLPNICFPNNFRK